MFIVFEGGEGAGKSSQVSMLKDALKMPCVVTKEPYLEWIKKTVFDARTPEMASLYLFLADRIIHINNVIKPALKEGKIVICDRYFLSTIAYEGYGYGIDIELIKELNDASTGNIVADIVFLLDIEPEKGLKRVKRDNRFEKEDISFHKRVRTGYLSLAKEDKNIKVLDGEKTKDEIHKIVMEELEFRI
ncbi:MAG: dTMP kinase [bacterium]